MSDGAAIFNPPPGWPQPPAGWRPPPGWEPDPSWPAPPAGWSLWLVEAEPQVSVVEAPQASPEATPPPPETRAQPPDDEAEEALTLDDEVVLQAVGIYRYHHPLENAAAYRDRLQRIQGEVADLVRSGDAIVASNMFTFDNSLAKGRRMTSDLGKLMLRAYNAEADTCLRTLRAGTLVTSTRRLTRSRDAIRRLGQVMEMHISDAYHDLRVRELELAADYAMKKQEEKEAAREERARLREERKVERELKEERERLEKEKQHLRSALDALAASGGSDPGLEQKLQELEGAIEQNDFRAANIRAGYVYVISNRGAFGRGVVKIGLTRRLEPRERVHELGGASVPFRFDVHGLFFSEDAVSLEARLHQRFSDRRVNNANTRKEFFFVSPEEVRVALEDELGALLEFTEEAESTEFLQSLGSWPAAAREARPSM